MGSHSTTVKLTHLSCCECGAGVYGGSDEILGTLRKSAGNCSACPCDQFRAVFSVEGSYQESIAKLLPAAVGFVMFGALGAVIIRSGAVGFVMFGVLGGVAAHYMLGGRSSRKTEYEVDLWGLDGRQLLEKMELPPQEAASWLHSAAKESAQARLASDQRICKLCGEIFTIGVAGHTAEGYCTPGCRKRDLKNVPFVVNNAEAEPAAAQALDCPHCNRKIHVKPGGKCIYCGKLVVT